MSEGKVADRYATALLELAEAGGAVGTMPGAVGTMPGGVSTMAEKVLQFSELYESSRELRRALENPVTPLAKREAVLSDVARRLQVPELAIRCLILMLRKGRAAAMPAFGKRFLELADERAQVVRARVVTAQKMPESYYQNLSAQIAAATKKKVVLEHGLDPSLIAGAVATIGDAVIDGSIRGRLQEVRRTLVNSLSTSS